MNEELARARNMLNSVLRTTLPPQSDKLMKGWRRLHDEELHSM
jgi:hypothetical protein